MSAGGGIPGAGPGGLAWYQGEPYDGDPRISPGLARGIGWRVREPDGTAAYDKFGPGDTDWTPIGTPSTGSTLAAVYAAGAGDRVNDDLMVLTHGNLRFQSPVDGNPLPLVGYWENVGGQGTAASGFPSELWSLAVIAGTDTGRRYAVYQMFDPGWNGTYAALNGMSWETERVTFTNDATNEYRSQNQNPAFGSRAWKVLNNWAPAAYPQGASASGTVSHETDLYNTIDLGLRFIDRMDGWGQTSRELRPQQNGITWREAIHWLTDSIVGAANDGLGWGVYAGDISHTNHLQAGLTCRQVTGDPLGDWYWSFFVADGSGGLLDVADFAKSGITFNAPVTLPATQQGVQAAYTTGLLDLTAAADNIPIPVPQRAGYIFVPRLLTTLIHDLSGTATGSLVWSAGNNAAHNNTATTTISAAVINATGAAAPQPVFANGGGASPLLDSGTQVVVKISTGVAGVTSLHGYLSISGFWVPV